MVSPSCISIKWGTSSLLNSHLMIPEATNLFWLK